jgi:hypothetical protein
MREVQLFIKGSDTSDYVKVDLFDDESISLTQTIKNAQDVSKIFTDFSKSFTIPASKTNSKLFKHYEKFIIDNGFDARKRVDARIEINSIPFKYGRVRLDGVELKDGAANAYKITFFGNTIKLKDSIGEEKLSALDLSIHNKVYGQAEVKTALTADPTSADVVVPLITHSQRLTYGSGTGVNTGDLKPGGNYGVLWSQLKYAIRIDAIVQAIADKYGFTYSSDSFFKNTNLPYYRLFMWLHRKKGDIGSEILDTPDFQLISGFNGNTDPSEFVWRNAAGSQIILEDLTDLTTFDLTISNPSGTNYAVSIRRDGVERIIRQNITDTSLNIDVLAEAREGSDYEVFLSANAATSFTFTWTAVSEGELGPQQELFSVTLNAGTNPDFNISEQIPEMKVIDFLSALFKMFNLVATIDENNVVTVKTLDDYYDEGETRDITKYTKNDSGSVDSATPYAEIKLKYKDTETILAKQFDQLKNREWGSDTYNTDDNLKEGGTFSLEIPFSHLQFERLNDLSTGNDTNVMYGYYVDDNQDPYLGAPLVFYPILNPLGSYPISYVTTTDADGNFTATETISTSVIVPSNTVTIGQFIDIDNIHFFPEANEYYPNLAPYKTLFYNYHWNYIASLFNFRKRMTKLRANLPVNFLINYSLADTLLYKGLSYRINSINTDLTTGDSSLELLNVVSVAKPTYEGPTSSTTTVQPTTIPPTTEAPPTTIPPTTEAPPTTVPPTTEAPPTTVPPTTIPPTTISPTTSSAATIDVYARTPLEAVGITVQYSVNGGAYQNDGSGAVSSSCGYLSTISGLFGGDSVVIRVVGTTTGINYPINGSNSTTCPTSVSGASANYSYGTVSIGANNVAFIIDNTPTPYTQQLGYNATVAANACNDYVNNILTTVYTDGNNLLNTNVFYSDATASAYSTDIGWYSDGTDAIYWNGTTVDAQVTCASQTTIAPTTTDPSIPLDLGYDTGGVGWVLSSDACSDTAAGTYFYHISKTDTVAVGTRVYTDNNLTTFFDGGFRWFKEVGTNNVIQIDDAGYILNIIDCSATTTTIQPTTTIAVSCTEYEIENYGTSSVTFSYEDCATGASLSITVITAEPIQNVCARTGTLQYVSGTFDYSVTNLGPC